MTGDGTTSTVLFIGELLRCCKRYIADGVHSRILVSGIDKAREFSSGYLDRYLLIIPSLLLYAVMHGRWMPAIEKFKKPSVVLLCELSCPFRSLTSCPPKLLMPTILFQPMRSDHAASVGVSFSQGADLHMVEVMAINSGLVTDTRLIKGIVMDHGCRHSDMPSQLKDVCGSVQP